MIFASALMFVCAAQFSAVSWGENPVRLSPAFDFVDIAQADMKVPAFAPGVSLRAEVAERLDADSWEVSLFSRRRGLAQRFSGSGRPPRLMRWYGVALDGSLSGNSFYKAELQVLTREGDAYVSPAVEVQLVKPAELSRLENHNLSFSEDPSNLIIRLPTLTYSPGSSVFSPELSQALDAVLEFLRGVGDKKILILGFADPTGSPERNRALSADRARRVYAYLSGRGDFPWERMRFGGMSDTRPIADNSTQEGRERNRRVEIWIRKA